MDTVLEKVAKAFGERAAERAGRAAGSGLFETRTAGALGIASGTGALMSGGARTVRPHTFHGDPSPSP